jgi:hypothetical protein
LYRSVFVDLAKVAAAVSTLMPRGAHVLDIGGGDGEPLNHLLRLRPDLRITSIDPQAVVGLWIEPRFAHQVTRLPGTTLADYLASGRPDPDVILMSDVMHHIPQPDRGQFLIAVADLLRRVPQLRIVVKDVEPGHWRAALGYWADRYITGDRQVSLISRAQLGSLLEQSLGPLRCEATDLFSSDRPNYALGFFR